MQLRKYLDQRNITLQQFADRIHRSVGYVCDVANGKIFPGPATQVLIDEATGHLVTPNDLLEGLKPEVRSRPQRNGRRNGDACQTI